MRGFPGFFALLALFSGFWNSVAHAETGVATVDMERVFSGYDRAKEMASRNDVEGREADRELEERQSLLRKQIAGIERLKAEVTNAPSPEKQRDLEAKIAAARKFDREIVDFRNARRKDIEDRALKNRQSLISEIRDAVNRVAKSKGCRIVLDSSASVPGGVPVVVYSDPASDLSGEVLAVLGNISPPKGAKRDAPAPVPSAP